jgi:hypothetical protein
VILAEDILKGGGNGHTTEHPAEEIDIILGLSWGKIIIWSNNWSEKAYQRERSEGKGYTIRVLADERHNIAHKAGGWDIIMVFQWRHGY